MELANELVPADFGTSTNAQLIGVNSPPVDEKKTKSLEVIFWVTYAIIIIAVIAVSCTFAVDPFKTGR